MNTQTKYICPKCGSSTIGIRQNPKNQAHTDVYCMDCGAWLKFANKDDKRMLSQFMP